MQNRRWFFTATGTAFLAAACAVVTDNGNEPECRPLNDPDEAPKTPDEQFNALIAAFFRGLNDQLGDDISSQRNRLEAYLRKIYRPRFDYRWEMGELPPQCYVLRIHQACVLGQLTGLAFSYESGRFNDPAAWSFEKPREKEELVLDERHIEWARDTYGLYTNRAVKKRIRLDGKKRPFDLCGEEGGPGRPQIDQACPFCFA